MEKAIELQDDALAKTVFFLSTTESRSKVYRLLQYGAKVTRWSLLQLWKVDASSCEQLNGRKPPVKQIQTTACEVSDRKQETEATNWKRLVIRSLSRAELVFGDARRLFRFLQFLEMANLYRHVNEPVKTVRLLRRLRILCFFFFYLVENYVVFNTRVLGVSPREPRMRRLRRSCNGFWLMSILLAFPLDHMLHRGTPQSTLKKFLDLPVASVGCSGVRVSDGLFGALGFASAQIGVYTRWLDAVAKFRNEHLKRLAAAPDVA